jgi:hypothetical protein
MVLAQLRFSLQASKLTIWEYLFGSSPGRLRVVSLYYFLIEFAVERLLNV